VVSTHLKKIGQKSNGNIPEIGINIKKALKPPENPWIVLALMLLMNLFLYFLKTICNHPTPG